MIYLPVSLLEPGMVLARDVPSANPMLSLMMAGQALTARAITNVTQRGIKGLYIEFGGSEDVQHEEFLNPELKQEMLVAIRTEFDKVQKRGTQLNYAAVGQMAEQIVLRVLDHDALLCNVLDIRDYDNYTYSHSLYVGMLGVVLGRQLNLPALRLTEIATAGLLHDIGKLDISTQIINKAGPLSDEEFFQVKAHPTLAESRLKFLPGCRPPIIQGVSTHHEHFNGDGYPSGLVGTRIPLYGRILGIADVYDALSSSRSYRKAWSPSQVIDYITSRSGTQFDPELVTAFLGCISAYPVGTLVTLSDGSAGMVIRNNHSLTLRPTIRLLSPAARKDEELDLSSGNFHITVLDLLSSPTEAAALGVELCTKRNSPPI